VPSKRGGAWQNERTSFTVISFTIPVANNQSAISWPVPEAGYHVTIILNSAKLWKKILFFNPIE
jgi:hypothetical protein